MSLNNWCNSWSLIYFEHPVLCKELFRQSKGWECFIFCCWDWIGNIKYKLDLILQISEWPPNWQGRHGRLQKRFEDKRKQRSLSQSVSKILSPPAVSQLPLTLHSPPLTPVFRGGGAGAGGAEISSWQKRHLPHWPDQQQKTKWERLVWPRTFWDGASEDLHSQGRNNSLPAERLNNKKKFAP